MEFYEGLLFQQRFKQNSGPFCRVQQRALIPNLKRCLNDLLGRTNFKTPISVSSHEGVKYIRTPPEIRVESLRSLRGILRCHPKSACSKKMVSAELTFANRKIHTFYWHGQERSAWAGACDGSGWSEVGASILVVRRFLLDLWFSQALPPSGRAGQPSPLADVPFRGPLDSG